MKKAIATLLSLTMALSILAQSPAAYAEEIAGFRPVVQEEATELTQGDPQDHELTVPPEAEDGTLTGEEGAEQTPARTEEPKEEPQAHRFQQDLAQPAPQLGGQIGGGNGGRFHPRSPASEQQQWKGGAEQ